MVRLLSNCFFFLLSGVIFAQSTIDVTILGDGKVTSSPTGIDCRGCNTGASLTYYVSDNGSDNNDGLTTNTPFQTFEYAFEKMRPGDNLEYLQGKKWYVSPNGNDNNDGLSRNTPFQTFNKLWTLANTADRSGPGDILQRGDIIILLDGFYRQTLAPNWYMNPAHNGGDTYRGDYLYIKAENDGKAIIDGEGVRDVICLINDEWAGYNNLVIDGLIARNGMREVAGSHSVVTVYGQNNIIRRVSAYNADPDDNNFLILAGEGSNNNLFVDCIAYGVGRIGLVTYKCQNTTFRRCFSMVTRWDGRNDHNRWPWQESAKIYNSSNCIMGNCIGYGMSSSANFTLLARNGWTADNNGFYGLMSVYSEKNTELTKLNPPLIGWKTIRPQPSLKVATHVRDMDNNPSGRLGFIVQGPDLISNSIMKDIFSFGNGGRGIAIVRHDQFAPQLRNLSIENATFKNNGVFPVDLQHLFYTGDTGTSMIQEDINEIVNTGGHVTNSFIDTVYNNNNTWGNRTDDSWYTMTGTGARLDHRYLNGTLTNKPLWPWPMDDRAQAELGFVIKSRSKIFSLFKNCVPT